MNIEIIRKSLTRLYRLFFVLACIVLFVLCIGQLITGVDADQYPMDGGINATVACIVIAALCRMVRDFLPAPTKNPQG